MKQRIITGFFYVLGIALLFLSRMLTPFIFDFGMGAFAVIGAVEVARVFERSNKPTNIIMASLFPALIYVGLCFAFVYQWSWVFYLTLFVGALIVYFLIVYAVGFIFKNRTLQEINDKKIENLTLNKYSLLKAINTIVVCVYPTILFCAIIILNHLNGFSFIASNSAVVNGHLDYYLLVSLFVVTMITDSGAMTVGSTFKGPKLCPLISPNKTISGALGGLCGGVLAAVATFGLFMLNNEFKVMYSALDLNIWHFIFFGFVGSVLCQCGDIFASLLKRRARVKDYGTLFPGHGGVMDRLDGLLFVAGFALIFLFIIA